MPFFFFFKVRVLGFLISNKSSAGCWESSRAMSAETHAERHKADCIKSSGIPLYKQDQRSGYAY